MGVQESLNQVLAELVNRRIQLSKTVDPNTDASLDSAPIGSTVLQTTATPRVVWRKERAGANGWDVEIIPSIQYNVDVYVDGSNTTPSPNGSRANPFTTIQAALDFLGSAVDLADYGKIYNVHILPGTYSESPVVPPARQLYFIFEGVSVVTGDITVTVNGALHPGSGGGYTIGVLTNSGMEASYMGFSDRSTINGSIVFNKIAQSPDNITLVVNQVYLGDAIIVPATVDPYVPTLLIARVISWGKDIGGGVWRSISAPGSDVMIDQCSLYSTVDVRTYQAMVNTSFFDGLILHSAVVRLMIPGPSGFIRSDLNGTITSVGKNLYLDSYSKKFLEASVADGYSTANLAHVGNLDDTRTPEVTVNAAATVTVDSFPITVGNYVKWDVMIHRGTTQYRRSIIGAVWTAAGSINTQGEIKLGDIGTTSDLTLSVDVSGGTTVRLRASAVTTSSWKVQAVRHIDYTGWWY
jgi:hypothetical protein